VWRERSSQEMGQEGEATDIREEEVNINLGEEREDSTLDNRRDQESD
jgi:hypothetical protein